MEETRTRRAPIRPPILKSDIYTTTKCIIPVQIKRVKKLFKEGIPFITIHGMGPAAKKAVAIAYTLKEEYENLEWEIRTSSVKLIDDVESKDLVLIANKDEEPTVNTRIKAAIHIKIKNFSITQPEMGSKLK